MTNPVKATHPDGGDFDQLAVGFGQRRVFLLAAMLGGLTITGAGLGWMLGAALVDQPLNSGLIMAGVGLVLAGIGWLATAGVRFTRKLPKPPPNNQMPATGTSNGVIGGWVTSGLVLAGVIAIVLFAPRGREPDVVALLPMIVAIPAVLLLGFYRIRHIMANRNEMYARWLAKRHG